MNNKRIIINFIICILFCTLPFIITAIVIGALAPGTCDYRDKIGLNVSDYLFGLGISAIIFISLCIVLFIFVLVELFPILSGFALVATIASGAIFGIIWFIIGSIILFRGNMECIQDKSAHVIFALILWIFSAFIILISTIGGIISCFCPLDMMLQTISVCMKCFTICDCFVNFIGIRDETEDISTKT